MHNNIIGIWPIFLCHEVAPVTLGIQPDEYLWPSGWFTEDNLKFTFLLYEC